MSYNRGVTPPPQMKKMSHGNLVNIIFYKEEKNGELGGVNRSYLSVCVCVVNLFIKNIMFFKGWLP